MTTADKVSSFKKWKTAGTRWLQRFLQNTNSNAKWRQRESIKEDKVTYLYFSEYSSIVPDIANSGLMDEKC